MKELSVFLSVVFFSTNILFAYSPEKSFWTERRDTAKRNQRVADSRPFPVLPAGINDLLPTTDRLTVGNSNALSETLARSLPKSFVQSHQKLFESLPLSLGTVRSVALPKGPIAHTVVYIQDVHLNADAQNNIAETVRSLVEHKTVGCLALEGAWEPMDFSRFRSFPDKPAVQKAANLLLSQNVITGPVVTALTGPVEFPVVEGVDDEALYHANVNAYKQSAPKAQEHKNALAKEQKRLSEKKSSVFNPALLALDQAVEKHRADQSSLGDYVRAIARVDRLKKPEGGLAFDSKHYPSVALFLEALSMEETLDFKRVESERMTLIQKLTTSLTPAQINALVQKSLAYRAGEIRHSDFYVFLKEFCQANGVALKKHPAMDAYIQYVLVTNKIEASTLLKEIMALEKESYAHLAKTPEEKILVSTSRRLTLTAKLLNFSLTPEEWKDYKDVAVTPPLQRGARGDFPGAEDLFPLSGFPSLSTFESFYQNAESRDEAMSKNLLSRLNATQSPTAVLITGGFHAEGVTERLNDAGVAVITYVPKIAHLDTEKGSSYLSIFTQEKTPLEKLFAGEKLFVNIELDPSLIGKRMALNLAAGRENLADARWALDLLGAHGINAREMVAGKLTVMINGQRAMVDAAGTVTESTVSPREMSAKFLDARAWLGSRRVLTSLISWITSRTSTPNSILYIKTGHPVIGMIAAVLEHGVLAYFGWFLYSYSYGIHSIAIGVAMYLLLSFLHNWAYKNSSVSDFFDMDFQDRIKSSFWNGVFAMLSFVVPLLWGSLSWTIAVVLLNLFIDFLLIFPPSTWNSMGDTTQPQRGVPFFPDSVVVDDVRESNINIPIFNERGQSIQWTEASAKVFVKFLEAISSIKDEIPENILTMTGDVPLCLGNVSATKLGSTDGESITIYVANHLREKPIEIKLKENSQLSPIDMNALRETYVHERIGHILALRNLSVDYWAKIGKILGVRYFFRRNLEKDLKSLRFTGKFVRIAEAIAYATTNDRNNPYVGKNTDDIRREIALAGILIHEGTVYSFNEDGLNQQWRPVSVSSSNPSAHSFLWILTANPLLGILGAVGELALQTGAWALDPFLLLPTLSLAMVGLHAWAYVRASQKAGTPISFRQGLRVAMAGHGWLFLVFYPAAGALSAIFSAPIVLLVVVWHFAVDFKRIFWNAPDTAQQTIQQAQSDAQAIAVVVKEAVAGNLVPLIDATTPSPERPLQKILSPESGYQDLLGRIQSMRGNRLYVESFRTALGAPLADLDRNTVNVLAVNQGTDFQTNAQEIAFAKAQIELAERINALLFHVAGGTSAPQMSLVVVPTSEEAKNAIELSVMGKGKLGVRLALPSFTEGASLTPASIAEALRGLNMEIENKTLKPLSQFVGVDISTVNAAKDTDDLESMVEKMLKAAMELPDIKEALGLVNQALKLLRAVAKMA